MGTSRRRPIWWDGDAVAVIDQRRLPADDVTVHWSSLDDAVRGIADMVVRGAPLIGVAAAHGMALALAADPSDSAVGAASAALVATRPTAVNLRWAVDRMSEAVRQRPLGERVARARCMATEMADEDAAACRAIGAAGLPMLRAVHERTGRPVEVLTHCNAGWLACVEWGTATAPVYLAHAEGIPVHVWVSETRPRNQGASLTAWELADAGVPHTLVVDNAAGHLLATGSVDLVIVGADRVAANGDAANKIGTSLKAYAAAANEIPFHVAIPWSTYDVGCPDGEHIPIEEREPAEVLELAGHRIAPPATPARNWGFDVTPARYITSFLTPDGVIAPGDLARRQP